MADQLPDQPAPRPEPVTVHDPRVLRAIAHPVRIRILEELGATGPMRAVDVAGALGVPANQASFHLRQLAKYGLVVEAPEAARDGRDRVWRAAHESGLSVDPKTLAELPGGKAAVAVFRSSWTAGAHDAVDRAALADQRTDARVMFSDTALRLTRDDAQAFGDALNDLVETWRLRGRAAPQEARTYQLLQILQPARDVES